MSLFFFSRKTRTNFRHQIRNASLPRLQAMVHAVICPLTSSSENKELVLLEFQGSFDTGEEPTVQNVKIGDIHFENVRGNPC